VSRPSILLIGAGGHARACIDVIEHEGRFAIAGLLGMPDEVGRHVLGYRVLGTDDDLEATAHGIGAALVAVGQIQSPEPRMALFARLQATGCELATVISPRAHVSRHAVIGVGTIVMHGAIVNASATVGRNCILNSQSLVEHDATVGDHCHIATGAMLNSGVSVGPASFIGSGTSVRQSVSIGANCVIGMGQRVLRDCADRARLPQASAV
jgi:sugar O-acyltransferase (sialic acid O-acetyltransferase NeuD family)